MQLPFASQSYQAHSLPLDAQRCVNFYTEISPKDAKTPVPVYGCAGIAPFSTVGNGPVYGWCIMEDLLYVVSGNGFYSVAVDGTPTLLGSTYVEGPVSIDNNGQQIVWVDGTTGWWWSAETGVQLITDPNFYPADVVVYFDTYFCFNRKGTNQWFLSPPSAVIPFNGAMFASKESTSDNIVSLVNTHEMMLVFGEIRTEIWFDAGNPAPEFPFQPYYGAYIQRGLMSPLAVCLEDNTTFFLGEDGVFYRLEYTLPLRISTHAVEKAWQSYQSMKGAWCFSYTLEGHKFVTINFPSEPATWVYDIASGLWHERVSWADNNRESSIGRWRINWALNAYNGVLFADSLTGQIGRASYNSYTEWGTLMRGEVSSPPVQSDRRRIFMRRFELDVESGIGVPYQAAYTTVPYALGSVQIEYPVQLATASGLVGFPPTFPAALFACWVYLPDVSLPEGFWFSNQVSDTSPGTPGLQIGIFNDQTSVPQIIVRAYDSAGNPIVVATYDYTAWSVWTLIMVSLDTASQTLQVWVSAGGTDTALTPASLTWSSTNQIAPSSLQPWHIIADGGNQASPQYQTTPANYGTSAYDQYVLPLWPTSNNYFLASVWIENPSGLGNIQVAWIALGGEWPFTLAVGNGTSQVIFEWQSSPDSGFSKLVWDIPASALSGAGMSVVVSVDTTQTASVPFQCFVNGVQLALASSSVLTPGIMAASGDAYISSTQGAGSPFCAADFYLTAPSSFFDLTVPANLAKFYNVGSGGPVNLGSSGQNPTGTSAQMLLQWSTAAGTVVNNGTQGSPTPGPTGYPVACALSPPTVTGIAQIANLFFGALSSLFDLTVVANRRLLVDSSGNAVYPGANGQLITGTTPAVFLSRTITQTASVFAQNLGSGGPFGVTGGNLAPYSTAPTADPYQVQLYAGDNLPPGADPQIMLDWSDDGGRSWSTLKKWRSMGKMGEYVKRLRWLKMGQARQRILRLQVSDPVRRNLIGFYLDIEAGEME